MNNEYNYFGREEAIQHAYFRIPKALILDPVYKTLSTDAKVLYGLMLDRMELSLKSGWIDESGRVFIFYTIASIQEHLNCGAEKAVKLVAELDSKKGIGLLERKQQGRGKPTIIYVKNFASKLTIKTSENQKSRLPENRSQDFGKSKCNKTEYINPEFINPNTPPISPSENLTEEQPPNQKPLEVVEKLTWKEYQEQVKDNLEYDILLERYETAEVEEILHIIVDTLCLQGDSITVGKLSRNAEQVKERLLSLKSDDVEYVFDFMSQNTSEIYNIPAYLLTLLYNAPSAKNHWYRVRVQHDMANTDSNREKGKWDKFMEMELLDLETPKLPD